MSASKSGEAAQMDAYAADAESLGAPGDVLPLPSPQGVNKYAGIYAGAQSQSQPPPSPGQSSTTLLPLDLLLLSEGR